MNIIFENGSAEWLDAVAKFAWPILVGLTLFAFRRRIGSLFGTLHRRLGSGDGVKIAGLELESSRIATTGAIAASAAGITDHPDLFDQLNDRRDELYKNSRRIVIVHRIFKSMSERHLFDIEVYCIPHKEATLASVKNITYCFGRHWGKKTYQSSARHNGFRVTTAAYGPTLCTALVEYNDGTRAILDRYIDFEMGTFAVALEPIAPP